MIDYDLDSETRLSLALGRQQRREAYRATLYRALAAVIAVVGSVALLAIQW